jgi:ankyrin repeat protein
MEIQLTKKRKTELQYLFGINMLKDDAENVKHMLDTDLEPDHRNSYGFTFLYQASRRGCLNIVRVLLENGASVNAVSPDNATPILAATYGNWYNIVELLIEKGGDATIPNGSGRSPFCEALFCKKYKIAVYLAKKGHCADINMIPRVLRVGDRHVRNLLLNYVPLSMREQTIQIILDSVDDPPPAIYEVSRAHISRIVTLDILLARELCPASPFHLHRFPLEILELIFAFCELPFHPK